MAAVPRPTSPVELKARRLSRVAKGRSLLLGVLASSAQILQAATVVLAAVAGVSGLGDLTSKKTAGWIALLAAATSAIAAYVASNDRPRIWRNLCGAYSELSNRARDLGIDSTALDSDDAERRYAHLATVRSQLRMGNADAIQAKMPRPAPK